MVPIQYVVYGKSAKQIADGFESRIQAGELQPGALLPSVRVLANELEVAPGTVALAYRVLRDRGLVEAHGRHGTYVRSHPPVAIRSSTARVSADVTDLASGQPDPGLLPQLPSRRSPASPAGAPAAFVLPEIQRFGRARLADDGIPAESLTLSSGGLDGIQRVLSAQLRPGDLVAVEDPGWPNALDLIAALGLRPYPMPLDAQGPLPEALRGALRTGARAVIVTNRAQNPTGSFLTAERAERLRGVLADYPQTLVIEDDHAAELAHVKLASLAGATDSWALIRSASKPYGPDLRLALVAGDQTTIARVDGRMQVSSGWISTLLQRMVLELWTSASAAAIIAKAAAAYDARRQQLITELADRGITSTGHTGLNVWIPVNDETAAVTSLLEARWAVAPGSRFRQTSPPGIRITVSALTPSTIPRLADDVATAITAAPQSAYIT